MKNQKKITLIMTILLLMLGVGIGYAYLNSLINIDGSAEIAKNTWNIHFENVTVKEGSVTPITPAKIINNSTQIEFAVDLNVPGEYYEFTVDVVNAGSIDAMVSEVIFGGVTMEQAVYTEYIVAYASSKEPIEKNDLIKAGEKETISVRIKFRDDIISKQLPTIDQKLNLTFKITYVQADENSLLRTGLVSKVLFENDTLGAEGSLTTLVTADEQKAVIAGKNPNNYIWYSGMLWRAVTINDSDKSVKLVTQTSQTKMKYNSTNNSAFSGSLIEAWLNDTSKDGFLGKLYNYQNIIKTDSVWNVSSDPYGGTCSKFKSNIVATATVGLLTHCEYIASYSGTTNRQGYLNIGTSWWTGATHGTSVHIIRYDGQAGVIEYPIESSNGVRPAINLKPNIKIAQGQGTADNPYTLVGGEQ